MEVGLGLQGSLVGMISLCLTAGASASPTLNL